MISSDVSIFVFADVRSVRSWDGGPDGIQSDGDDRLRRLETSQSLNDVVLGQLDTSQHAANE